MLEIKDYVNKNLLIVDREKAKVSSSLPLIECRIEGCGKTGKYVKVSYPNKDYLGGWMELKAFDVKYDIVEVL